MLKLFSNLQIYTTMTVMRIWGSDYFLASNEVRQLIILLCAHGTGALCLIFCFDGCTGIPVY